MSVLSDYLTALIPPPNNLQPNFVAWVSASLQIGIDIQTVLNSLIQAFSIQGAVGVQLDVVGQLLGLSRTLNFQPTGGVSAVMTDDIYRLTLQAKILQNRWNGTIPAIYEFWRVFFPSIPVAIQDNQDMTMTVTVFNLPTNNAGQKFFSWNTEDSTHGGWNEGFWSSNTGSLLQQIIQHGYFTPKPAGVQVSYVFSSHVRFAWNVENNLLKGWNEGSWS